MRVILKILALPLLLVLALLCLAGKLSTNLAGYVYSVLLLVVIGCGIFAIVKAQWTNLAILAGMALAGFIALFILAWVAFKAETMQEQLGDFIRS